MDRKTKNLLIAGIVVAVYVAGMTLLLGGYNPVIRGFVGIPLWIIAVLAPPIIIIYSIIYGVFALLNKNFRKTLIALFVILLVVFPFLLPLPNLFAK